MQNIKKKMADGTQAHQKQQAVVESDTLYSVLSDYKKLQVKYKKEYGKKYKRYTLKEIKNKYGKLVEYKVIESQSRNNKIQMVFTRKDGTYTGTDIIKYPFKIIHYELGISCRFYDLRGSFATISLRGGCEIKDIAEVLGHKRIETTEKYYISSTSEDKKTVSKILEQNLKNYSNFKMQINCYFYEMMI